MSKDILLAHSGQFERTMLEKMFHKNTEGRLKAVENGRDAIASLRRGQFDALLVAEQLDDVDAWRMMRMVRSGVFCPAATPVIVLCESPLEDLEAIADSRTYLIDSQDPARVPSEVVALLSRQHKHRILLVEDDKPSAAYLADSLGRFYEVTCAYDGEQAIQTYSAQDFDLVLLDLMLPVIDGREVLQQIHATAPNQRVIVLTAFDSPEKHESLMLQGAAEFLAKPVDVNQLLETCDGVLREAIAMGTLRRLSESRQVTDRIRAADYSLERGQAATASSHLKAALASTPRTEALSDDHWAQLLTEFPGPKTDHDDEE